TEQQTLAGGIILSAEAERRHFHTAERKRFLEHRAAKPTDVGVFICSELERVRFAPKDSLLLNARFSATEIADAVRTLSEKKLLVVTADFIADANWWNDLRDR